MTQSKPQQEVTESLALLDSQGHLTKTGWARQAFWDCNLEAVRFYPLLTRPLQHFRVKRWDYYGIITPTHFYSFTLADLGYAGQVFAYILDFAGHSHHEETLTIPFGHGIQLPRNSTEGTSHYEGKSVRMTFQIEATGRRLSVDWDGFNGSKLAAEIFLHLPPEHESLVITIPIKGNRFYYNRKINCLPAEGWIESGGQRLELSPETHLGNLDWGRGVWEYKSFWVWASASGFFPDQRRVGLNLGFGFGDTSAATENALILDGRIHKLGQVDFIYDSGNFMAPWRMISPDGRLDLTFTPFYDRTAATNLLLITSEVHQMFGHYSGTAITDDGETLKLEGLLGFAEEHHAKW